MLWIFLNIVMVIWLLLNGSNGSRLIVVRMRFSWVKKN